MKTELVYSALRQKALHLPEFVLVRCIGSAVDLILYIKLRYKVYSSLVGSVGKTKAA